MSRPESSRRRIASVLMDFSERLLAPARIDWARAMRAEFHYIDNDRRAFYWALGCLLAGLKERMHSMTYGNLKISRWLLAPEMLLCFVPLSWLWLDGIDGQSGLAGLNGAVIHKYFAGVPGMTLLVSMYAGVLLATIGPLALIAAFRMIALRTPIKHAGLRIALIAAPILFGLMSLAVRAVESGAAAFSPAAADAFDFWSGILLLSVLPALGAVHLLKLSPRSTIDRNQRPAGEAHPA